MAKVITRIEEEADRVYRPKDAPVKRGKLVARSGFKAQNGGSKDSKENSYNSPRGLNLGELKNIQKSVDKRPNKKPKHKRGGIFQNNAKDDRKTSGDR